VVSVEADLEADSAVVALAVVEVAEVGSLQIVAREKVVLMLHQLL
jgi:hypothetical protein